MKERNIIIVTGLLGLLVGVLLGLLILLLLPKITPPTKEEAFNHAVEYVQGEFELPSTARYSEFDQTTVYKLIDSYTQETWDGTSFSVYGYVNTPERLDYMVHVRYNLKTGWGVSKAATLKDHNWVVK